MQKNEKDAVFMYSGKYEITEHVYEIQSRYEDIHVLCEDYKTDKPTETVIQVSAEDIEYEQVRSQREMEREGIEIYKVPEGYLETLAVYRKIATQAPSRGMFLFHCSAIAVDGQAYAFTAKSGTGKSTHTALWRKAFGDRAVMVNDDKPIIGIKNGVATVYGTPWKGKHGLGANISVPLKAICFLSRGAENRIRKVSANEMMSMLLNQTFRPKDPIALRQTLFLLSQLTEAVSFYALECNMEDEAALVSYSEMNV